MSEKKVFTDPKELENELKQNKDKWLGKIITFMNRQGGVIAQFRIIEITNESIKMERLSPPSGFTVAA